MISAASRTEWSLHARTTAENSPFPTNTGLRQLAERSSSGDGAALCRRSAHCAIDVNNRALDLRDHGRLDEVEGLLQIALAIDVIAASRLTKIPRRRDKPGRRIAATRYCRDSSSKVSAATSGR